MRSFRILTVVLIFSFGLAAYGKKAEHEWRTGKILDENRARYFAGMLHDSSSQTTESGSVDGTATSTSIGDTTNTRIDGTYSGTSSTSTSGSSVAIYKVYDNLVVEGSDLIYITSERIRWRWSKGAHVAVNEAIKYYVDGRKLHVLDEDSREHTMEIIKEIRKPVANLGSELPIPSEAKQPQQSLPISAPTLQASLSVQSTPPNADIEIDGAFVGNTPSTIPLTVGNHQVVVRKKGFDVWTKTLSVTGGAVHLSAELDQSSPQQ